MNAEIICQVSGQKFPITDQEVDFFRKMKLPLPRISPKYRDIMRMAFRNERNLFKRKCDLTGESMISVYRPESPFVVYQYDAWMSDKWTPPSLNYDPNRNFFEQFAELQRITPRVNLFSPFNENCDYVNAAEKNKNCYLIFLSDRCEDSYYLDACFACKNCMDCSFSYDCELCYESADLRNCYHCRWSFLSENSSFLTCCFDMKGCQNCFMSFGLRHKQYYILNQQYTKEEYEKKMSEIDFSSVQVVESLLQKFFSEVMPDHYSKMLNIQNSSGNFQINTKNCHHCYDMENAQDCMYVRVGIHGIKDVHDSHAVVHNSELIYGNVSTTQSYNCHNVVGCWANKNVCYSEYLQGCEDCIGCISLRRKRFCIFNKQYSPDEYQRIRSEIAAQMGDYFGQPFPLSIAPFSYMDSAYRDYYDLSRDEVERLGWNYGLAADQEDKPFRITQHERALLEKINAPVPEQHYDLRFKKRVRFHKR